MHTGLNPANYVSEGKTILRATLPVRALCSCFGKIKKSNFISLSLFDKSICELTSKIVFFTCYLQKNIKLLSKKTVLTANKHEQDAIILLFFFGRINVRGAGVREIQF